MAVGTGRVRISEAGNLETFVRRARLACPVEVVVIVAVKCHRLAHVWLRQVLRDHHSHGNWFELSDEIEALIQCIAEGGERGMRDYLAAHGYKLPARPIANRSP